MTTNKSKRAWLIAVIAFLPILGAPTPATAAGTPAERWASRKPEGSFDSAKSSIALEWCIARQIESPRVGTHKQDSLGDRDVIQAPR